MEYLLTGVGIATLMCLRERKKERFEPVYLDSEEYYKQYNDGSKIAHFAQTEPTNGPIVTGYNNPYALNSVSDTYYPISNPNDPVNQKEFIDKNNLYNNKMINGIPLKDYYEKYTTEVLTQGKWFLNKDMPQDTKQYLDDSQVQQRMEEQTGLRQKRDREALGKPNKTEIKNMFTPEEKTTGYGYQYGSGGPGLAITRQKELEELKMNMKFKNKEQPFEKIHVGRGLAVGTEVPAAGGFQQYTRIMPDNISDYKANQLPGMVAGGKWAYSNAPTAQAPVVKNRVNKYYSLCQHGPAAGKSTITAELVRPDYSVTLKNQNRTTVNYGFGAPMVSLQSFLAN